MPRIQVNTHPFSKTLFESAYCQQSKQQLRLKTKLCFHLIEILHLQQKRQNFQDLWHKQWWIYWQERVSLDDHIRGHQSRGHTNCLSGHQIINDWHVLIFRQHVLNPMWNALTGTWLSIFFICYQRCDKDKDGKLDFQEFQEMITRYLRLLICQTISKKLQNCKNTKCLIIEK